jgi:hypothetical protein
MSFGQVIKGTILPRVQLKELWDQDTALDTGSKNPTYIAKKNMPDSAQETGAITPFVRLAGKIVNGIETMTIDETGFIPRVSLTFVDGAGEFAGDNFPKTDIIMSVYLKANNENFKPVRCDFIITGVTSMPTAKSVGIGTTYTVKGELFIPRAYTNISKSYAKLNSKDALKRVCDELGLGFAENESSPSDKMTWINSNMSSLQFIQHVVEHAYQDDDSFFMAFIDKYYYLNYIEVNRQLLAEDFDATFQSYVDPLIPGVSQSLKDDPQAANVQGVAVPNYLTTEVRAKNKFNYIEKLNLVSNHGEIIKTQGYKKNIYYYDHLRRADEPSEKFVDFFMTPLKSIDRRQDNFLIPDEESLAESKIKKWMNIDYGNAHPEWNAARLTNSHNLKELDKLKLKVTLNNIHFQTARGFTIPVYVSINQAEQTLKSKETALDTNSVTDLQREGPDAQLTGYYYVMGAKYHFDRLNPSAFTTELFLARREWAPSKIIDPNA